MNALSTPTYGPLGRACSALAVVAVLVAAVLATLFGQAPAAHATVGGTADYPVTLAGATTGQVPLATATRWGTGFIFSARAINVQPSRLSSELQHVSAYYQVQAQGIGSTVWQTVATAGAGADLTQWVPNPWDDPENDSEMLAAAGKQLPTMQFPSLRVTSVKHYRVLVTVTWSVPDTGRQLGSVTLAPQIAGDLRCDGGGLVKCQVVQAGAPVFQLKP